MQRKLLLLSILWLPIAVFAQITITDATINAGETVTLAADQEYLLDGFVFVEDGATLIIEPGTVIRGKQAPTTGDNASALIIARGGTIMADGTAQNPIVFTAEIDDLSNPNDLTWEDRGLWGGVILLGHATTNRGVEGQIEGIPTNETRATYGGEDDNDSSGVLRYVSVRHAGAELGPGDEINGVTFGAVGSQTVVEHVEVFANLDDGFEWFGGTVNTKWLVAAFCGDDGFDYDEGWRGKNQFWFAVQDSDTAGRIGEHDGGTVDETGMPFATPEIYNATYIGPGVDSLPQGDGSEAIIFRDNAGGTYANSIVTEYSGGIDSYAVTVEDIDGEDSRSRMESGELTLANNIWWQFGRGNTFAEIAPQDFVNAHLVANNNQISDPMLQGVSRIADQGLDPRPAMGGPAASGAMAPEDNFFMTVAYFGAFDPGAPLWTDGWTALSDEGHTSTTAIASDRWVPHVTRFGAGFSTRVYLHNQSAQPASVTLQPFDGDGTSLASVTFDLDGDETLDMSKSEAFGGREISHFSIVGSQSVVVTVGYKMADFEAGTAHVNESSVVGRSFLVYPGEVDIVFDGMALVNVGNDSAQVTIETLDSLGNTLSATVVADGLTAKAKFLTVFDDFQADNPALIRITSTQDASVVILRGTRVGQVPGYLFQVVPILGN